MLAKVQSKKSSRPVCPIPGPGMNGSGIRWVPCPVDQTKSRIRWSYTSSILYIFHMNLKTPHSSKSIVTQNTLTDRITHWGDVLRAISTPPNFQWLITVVTDKKNLSIRALPYQPLAPPGFRRGHHSQPRPPRPCTAVSNIMRTLFLWHFFMILTGFTLTAFSYPSFH